MDDKSDYAKAQETEIMEKSCSQEDPTVFNSSPHEDLRNSSPSPVSKLLEDFSLDCSVTDETPDSAVLNGKAEDPSYFHINGRETDEGQESVQSSRLGLQSSPVKRKPPAVFKKPKLSFLATNEPLPSQHDHATSLSQTEDQVDAAHGKAEDEENEEESEQQEEDISESTEPLAGSSEACTGIKHESHISASASEETSLDSGPCTNGEVHHEEEEEADGTSSTTGSISSQEDDTGESDWRNLSTFHSKLEMLLVT